MAHFWQGLRSGDWLTRPRMRDYSLILLALYAVATVVWIGLSDGLIDRNGRPIGTDFSSFYAAGSLTLEGHAADAYAPSAHHAREQRQFGEKTPYYSWNYPPVFLLIAAPLALLPYPLALALFQAAGLALYLMVIAAILAPARRRDPVFARNWLPAAAAFPAVFINLGHGQNGFMTAALLGAALVTLERPVVSGLCIGLLCYKPQFALVIPIALLAAGRWRVIASAAATTMALVAFSWLFFGTDTWTAFLASTEMSRKVLLEQGSVGFEKLPSAFAAVRMWGGSVPLAYSVQATLSIALAATLAWLWRSDAAFELKAAALAAASLLATPYMLDYDLVVAGLAIAYLARLGRARGFRSFDISLLAAAWIVPLLSRGIAKITGIPLGLSVLLLLYAAILHHALDHRKPSALGAPSAAAA